MKTRLVKFVVVDGDKPEEATIWDPRVPLASLLAATKEEVDSELSTMMGATKWAASTRLEPEIQYLHGTADLPQPGPQSRDILGILVEGSRLDRQMERAARKAAVLRVCQALRETPSPWYSKAGLLIVVAGPPTIAPDIHKFCEELEDAAHQLLFRGAATPLLRTPFTPSREILRFLLIDFLGSAVRNFDVATEE